MFCFGTYSPFQVLNKRILGVISSVLEDEMLFYIRNPLNYLYSYGWFVF
ncbi:MAG: hypothetical protein JWO06_3605 [Bacteroidota bacterium]|nr:hypothetical protein [Bacteroidota bacterium]